MKKEVSNYLINLIPKCEKTIRPRNNHLPTYNCQTDCFNHSFFPSTLNDDWLSLDVNLRNTESISIFKSRTFYSTRLKQNWQHFCPQGLKFLTHLRLCLSHLNEHRFRHNFHSFDIIWRSQIHFNTYCVAIIFTSIALILWIVLTRYSIILSLCLTMIRKMSFNTVALVLMKIKLIHPKSNYNLYKYFWKIIWISF